MAVDGPGSQTPATVLLKSCRPPRHRNPTFNCEMGPLSLRRRPREAAARRHGKVASRGRRRIARRSSSAYRQRAAGRGAGLNLRGRGKPAPARKWPGRVSRLRGAKALCRRATGGRRKTRWRSWWSRSADHAVDPKGSKGRTGFLKPQQPIGSTPTGTRTPVPWLRTKYPRPLDDGGMRLKCIIDQSGGVKRVARWR